MKLTIIFLCAFVAISRQQYQQRPRGVIWLAPYYSRPQPVNSYKAAAHYYDNAPYFNQEFTKGQLLSQDNLDENEDYQSRITGSLGQQQQNNARFFFNSISNPFAAAGMSAPVVTSVVTTVASIVTCVPNFQFLGLGVNPVPPACAGRKKREMVDFSEDDQFPIVPSETLKLMPTTFPSFHRTRENRQILDDQQGSHESLVSSKDDVTLSNKPITDNTSLREKRFFFHNNAVTSISTSYVFVPTVLTQTVNLVVPAPSAQCVVATGAGCADCLPAGYVVCPA